MRFRITILAVLAAASALTFADEHDTLEKLIARAEAARPDDRPGLYIAICERQLKAAEQLYGSDKPEAAQATVKALVDYAEKAHDAATQTGKRLKDTEIAYRKMAARLRDLKRGLDFQDQAPVQAAADRLENLRTDLLSHMFGKKK
jgi:hypothetical protein